MKKLLTAVIALIITSTAIALGGCNDNKYLPFEVTVDDLQVTYYPTYQAGDNAFAAVSVAADGKHEYAYVIASPLYSDDDKYGIQTNSNSNSDWRIEIQIVYNASLCSINNISVMVNGETASVNGEEFDVYEFKAVDYYYSLPSSLKGVDKFEISISGLEYFN